VGLPVYPDCKNYNNPHTNPEEHIKHAHFDLSDESAAYQGEKSGANLQQNLQQFRVEVDLLPDAVLVVHGITINQPRANRNGTWGLMPPHSGLWGSGRLAGGEI